MEFKNQGIAHSIETVFKPGVSILGVEPEMVIALRLAEQEYAGESVACVVTSVAEGTHKVGSLHYTGCAMDFRTKHIHPGVKLRLVAKIKGVLRPLGFDVLFEHPGEENEHLHVEFDPDHTNLPPQRGATA